MPEALEPRLFDAFARGTGATGGSGLGLHLTREIMRALGGEVEWRREASRTIFGLRFPAPNLARDDRAPRTCPEAVAPSQRPTGGRQPRPLGGEQPSRWRQRRDLTSEKAERDMSLTFGRAAVTSLMALSLTLGAPLGAFAQASSAAPAAPRPDPDSPARFDEVRKVIRQTLEEAKVPSIAVAVVKEGKIIWEEGFGWADKERQIPRDGPHALLARLDDQADDGHRRDEALRGRQARHRRADRTLPWRGETGSRRRQPGRGDAPPHHGPLRGAAAVRQLLSRRRQAGRLEGHDPRSSE